MIAIMFTRADGGVTIRRPAPHARLMSAFGTETFDPPVPASLRWINGPEPAGIVWAETETEQCAREIARDSSKAADTPVIIDTDDLPQDRTLRNAWQRNGSQCVESRTKAQAVAEAQGITVLPGDTIEDIRTKVRANRPNGPRAQGQ